MSLSQMCGAAENRVRRKLAVKVKLLACEPEHLMLMRRMYGFYMNHLHVKVHFKRPFDLQYPNLQDVGLVCYADE